MKLKIENLKEYLVSVLKFWKASRRQKLNNFNDLS